LNTEVDERVVEMKFDNKDFEKNVSTSMNTLKKFKASLKFEGATKGMEDLNKEASKFSLNNMSESVEKVEMQFSALSVVAVRAISRIVDSAMDAGIKLVKSLSVDNIAAGWAKLDEKTSQVQTIMNATGKSINEVNGYLDKLMWFSDETSYGFNDMTQAIAQMTSSGGDIEKLIPMVQGVANATAFAGKNAAEFSRVMYNLNQSYGAGYLTYMDWRSVELAGVASKQLKQTFIDIGETLGKIEKGEVTVANFSQTLRDRWADTEVMEAAFGYFAEMSDMAYQMVQTGEVETASEAYEILAKRYDTVSLQAAKAAQEAKTFQEVIDYTKDAVGSGWMKTFELIFGNYEEAKKLYTQLAEEFYQLFVVGGEKRNELFGRALQGGLQQLKMDGLPDIEQMKDLLYENAKASGVLTEALDDLIQTDFEESLKEGWVTFDVLKDSLIDVIKITENLSDAQLKEAGYTQEQINAYRNFRHEVLLGNIDLDEYVNKLMRMSGRENLVQAFWNIWNALFAINQETGEAVGIISVFKQALSTIFPEVTAEGIYQLTVRIKEFTEGLIFTDDQALGFKKILTALLTPVRWLVQLLGLGAQAFGFIGKQLVNLVGNFGALFKNARPGYALLQKWFGNTKATKIIEKWDVAVQHLKDQFSTMGDRIKTAWENFKSSDIVTNSLSKIKNAMATATDWITDGIVAALDWISNLDLSGYLEDAIAGLKIFVGWIKDAYTWTKDFVSGLSWENVSSWFSNFIVTIKEFKKQFNFKIDLSWLDNIIEKIKTFGSKFGGVISPIFKTITKSMQEFVKNLTPGRILIFAFSVALISLIINLTKVLDGASWVTEEVAKFAKKMRNLLTITSTLKAFTVMIAVLAGSIWLLANKTDPQRLQQVAEILTGAFLMIYAGVLGLVAIANKLAEVSGVREKLLLLSATFLSLSVSVMVLAGALSIISNINMEKIVGKFVTFSFLLAEFAGIMYLAGRIAQPTLKSTGGLIGIAVAMLVLAMTLKKLSSVDSSLLLSTVLKMIPVMAALALVARIAKGLSFGGALGVTVMIANILLFVRAVEKLTEVDVVKLLSVFPQYLAIVVGLRMLSRAVSLAGEGSKGLGKNILFMTAGIYVLALAIKKLQDLSWVDAAKGTAVISFLILMISGIIAVSKLEEGQSVAKMSRNFLALAGAIAIISLCVWGLGSIPLEDLAKGYVAITTIMGLMAVIIAASKNANKAAGAVLAIGLTLAIISTAIAVIGMGMTWQEVAVALGGLTVAMLLLAATVKILNNIIKQITKEFKISDIGPIALVFIEMGAMLAMIVYAFQFMPKEATWQEIVAFGGAIAAGVLSLAAAMALMNKFPPVDAKTIGKSLLELAGVIVVLGVLTAALMSFYSLTGLQEILKNNEIMLNILKAIGMMTLLGLAMAPVAAAFGLIGKLGVKAISTGALGLVEFLAAISLAAAGIMLLYGGTGLSELITNPGLILSTMLVLGLMSDLALSLAPVAAAFSVIGTLGPAAVSVGALALVEFLVALGIAGAAIAALLAGLQALGITAATMDAVVEIAHGMGEAIGQLVGGVVGGFANVVMTDIGTGLENLFGSIGSIDMSAIENFQAITDALLTFAKANILDSLAGFLGSKTTLSEFGEQFVEFVPYLIQASQMLEGFDLSNVETAAHAMASFGELIDALPREGGLVGSIIGNKQELKTFAEGIGPFGEGMRDMLAALPPEINTDLVESAKNAGLILTELQNALPREGGLVQMIIGEAGDMKKFSEGIVDFAKGIVEFQTALTENGFSFNKQLADDVTNAGKALAELNNALPGEGGVLQTWLGHKDMATWSLQLPVLATGLVGFQKNLTANGFKFDKDTVTDAANAGKALAELNSALPATGGKLEAWLFGEQDLGSFAINIEQLGTGLRAFADTTAGITKATIEGPLDVVNTMADIAERMDKIQKLFDAGMSLSSFSTQVSTAGDGLKYFGEKVDGISWDTALEAVNVLEKLANLATNLGNIEKIQAISGSFGIVGFEGVQAFADAFKTADAESMLVDAGSYLVEQVKIGINKSRDSEMKFAGETAAGAFFVYFTSKVDDRTPSVAAGLMKSIRDAVFDESFGSDLEDAGGYVVTGIQRGIEKAWPDLITEMVKKAKDIVSAFQNELVIQSPSKVMRDEVGKYIVQGIAEGITEDMSAEDAAKKKAENIVNAFKEYISKIDTEISKINLDFNLWSAVTIHETEKDRMDHQLKALSDELKAAERKLSAQEAQFKAIAENFAKDTDTYIEAANELTQARIDFIDLRNSYADMLASMEKPEVQINETGNLIIKGILNSITSDMTAEEAASQKAQNILDAFQKVFDSYDLKATTRDLEDRIWEAGNPKPKKNEQMLHDVLKNKLDLEDQAKRSMMAEAQYQAMVEQFGKDSKEAQEAYNAYLEERAKLAELAAEKLELQKKGVAYDRAMETINSMSEEEIKEFLTLPASNAVRAVMDEAVAAARTTSDILYGDDGIFTNINNSEALRAIVDGVEVVFRDEIPEAILGSLGYIDEATGELVADTDGIGSMITSLWDQLLDAGDNEGILKDLKSKALGYLNSINIFKNMGIDNPMFDNWISDLNAFISNVSGKLGEGGKEAGSNMGEGILTGLKNWFNKLTNGGANAANAVIDGASGPDGFDSNSPSKNGEELGEYFVIGICNGLLNLANDLTNAGITVADAAVSPIEGMVTRIEDILSSDLDVEPVITPIIDISDVQSKTGLINAMLDTNGAYKFAADTLEIQSKNERMKAYDKNAPIDNLTRRMDALVYTLDDLREMIDAQNNKDLNIELNIDGNAFANATVEDFISASRAKGKPFYTNH